MTESGRQAVNRTNPNDWADRLRVLVFGDVLAGNLIHHLRRKLPEDSAYVDSTLERIPLPASMKAAAILRATVVAGGVTGELVVKLYGVTPGSGEIAVAPNGDIVVLEADAITSLDVVYAPERGVEVEAEVPVDPSTGILEIPPAYVSQGVILLTEAESTAGTLVSKMEILVPTSSAPATGNARLSIAKHRVYFAVADAVTKARVKFLLAPPATERLEDLLEATAPF